MERFQGRDESTVIERFGRPGKTYPDKNGLKVMVYGERGVMKKPDCVVSFFIDDEGSVRRWNWNGRHCRAFARQLGIKDLDIQ